MRFHYDRLVLGYHGCRRNVRDALLAGEPFEPSRNSWDWLGAGIYFWEYGYQRAADWARTRYGREGAVVGAVIQLGNSLDLLDTHNTQNLAKFFRLFEQVYVEKMARPLPPNRGADPDRKLRNLDCAVINYLCETAQREKSPYDTVRGVFQEGEPAFPNSFIRRASHIQVAVRNPECIVGLFQPYEGATRPNPM